MAQASIDYEAVYRALPGMVALLTPDLVFADVNEAYVRGTGRPRASLLGRHVFDVFPESVNVREAKNSHHLRASLLRVLATGERDAMALQRYDVETPEHSGQWQEHYWSPVNSPVLAPDGRVRLIVHRIEEVTEFVRARGLGATPRAGCWRPSCTRAPVSCRSSTTGCVRRTPGSVRWRWCCRRPCSRHAGRWAITGPPCGTGPRWAR